MKYRIFTIGLAAILFAACSVNEMDITTLVNDDAEVFFASIEDASTKVFVDDNLRVLWNADDRVSIFNKYTYNQEYRFSGEDGDNSGAFKKVDNGDFVTGNALSLVYSVYPYQESTKISNDGVITVNLPAEQTYRENSFGLGANTMISCTEDNQLLYKNLCGYISVKLYGDNVAVKSISLKGNNDEPLAGKATVTASTSAAPSMAFDASATKEITLVFDSPVTLGTTAETATTFWLVVPPTTFSKGITLTVKDDKNGEFKKSTSSSLQVSRNTLKRMSALQTTPEPSDDAIVFADPAAKYACVAKYDTNGDGEVSFREAEAATSFDGLFTDWKAVANFDEIRYFKNVHSLNRVFMGCNKLVSITVPENITDLGSYAFSDCSSLSSVELPSGITTIGSSTFRNCSSLASIDIPSNVSSIGSYAFNGCSSLTAVELPSGVTSISFYAFERCSSLISITIPESVTSIEEYAFNSCSSLNAIELPNNVSSLGKYVFNNCSKLKTAKISSGVTSIPEGCFQDCTSLASVTLPEGVTSVGYHAFSGVKMWKLELPSSITSLGSYCFGRIVCIILPSTSPVTIKDGTFNGNQGIFVPSNLIDMYSVMTNWSNYASKLHPINTYKDKNEYTLATSGTVDMGTSVKWAAYNLGATKPEGYGDYYAWGETQTKYIFTWNSYRWCNGDKSRLTKYCPAEKTDYWDGEGTPDGKNVLDLEDDAAHVNLGGSWRMPTEDEWSELMNCLWEWTTYEGINGEIVYDIKSGNSIFLPAAGKYGDARSHGFYWSSSLWKSYPSSANWMDFDSDNVRMYSNSYNGRYSGFSIRPVCD